MAKEGNTTRPFASRGFYSSTNPAYFIQCGESYSEAAERCESHDECEVAYTSRLCSQCSDGYFSSDEECHKCKGATGPGPLIALLIVVGIFLSTLFWLLLSEAAASHPSSNDHFEHVTRISPSGIRWLCGWILRLWREALLMVTELAAVVVLSLFGLRETFEVVVLAVAFAILTTYLTVSRVISIRAALSAPPPPPLSRSLLHDPHHDGGLVEPLMRDSRANSSATAVSEAAEEEIESQVLHVESIIKVVIIYLQQTLSAILGTFSVEWTGSMLRWKRRVSKSLA